MLEADNPRALSFSRNLASNSRAPCGLHTSARVTRTTWMSSSWQCCCRLLRIVARPNHAMERTTDRCTLHFRMTSTLSAPNDHVLARRRFILFSFRSMHVARLWCSPRRSGVHDRVSTTGPVDFLVTPLESHSHIQTAFALSSTTVHPRKARVLPIYPVDVDRLSSRSHSVADHIHGAAHAAALRPSLNANKIWHIAGMSRSIPSLKGDPPLISCEPNKT